MRTTLRAPYSALMFASADERAPLRAGAQRTRLDNTGIRCATHVVDARRSVHLDRQPVEVPVHLEAEGRQRVAARQCADRAGRARQPDDVPRVQVADFRRRQLEQRLRHRLRLRHDVLADSSQLHRRRARVCGIADVPRRHDAAADAGDDADAAGAARVLRVRAAASPGEGRCRRAWQRRTAARGDRGAHRSARQSWRGGGDTPAPAAGAPGAGTAGPLVARLPPATRHNGAGDRGPNFVFSVAADGLLRGHHSRHWRPRARARQVPSRERDGNRPDLGRRFVYAATSNTCGGAPTAVYAMDFMRRDQAGDDVGLRRRGHRGPRAGQDGTVYVSTGSGGSALRAIRSSRSKARR